LTVDLGGGHQSIITAGSRKKKTNLVPPPIDFEYRQISVPINLIPRRMSRLAFHLNKKKTSTSQPFSPTPTTHTHLMPYRLEPTLHILQAKLAYPQPPIRDRRILFRERGIIPRLDVIRPEPDRSYSKHPRFEFRSLEGRTARPAGRRRPWGV
jgi:hypothetical protein